MKFGTYNLAVREALYKAKKEKGEPLTKEEVKEIINNIPIFYDREDK